MSDSALRPPGPPEPPYCDFCERGRPAGVGPSYRQGCGKHDPALQQLRDEAATILAVVDFIDLDDDQRAPFRKVLHDAGLDEDWLRGYLRSHGLRLANDLKGSAQ